jgi:hypothetical protein
MKIKRTPVILKRRPDCFGTFADCKNCTWSENCKKYSFTTVTTLAEASTKRDKRKTHEDFDRETLLRKARNIYKDVTGKKVYWRSDKWLESMEKILSYCEEEDVDPEIYVTAQIDALAEWLLRNNRDLFSNMFLGKKAYLRYMTYLVKQESSGGSFKIPLDRAKRDSEIVEWEFSFATRFILMNMTEKEAVKSMKTDFPEWSRGTCSPILRNKALSRLLNRYYLKSASKWVFTNDKDWSWQEAKNLIKNTIDVEEEKIDKGDFNSELGILI